MSRISRKPPPGVGFEEVVEVKESKQENPLGGAIDFGKMLLIASNADDLTYTTYGIMKMSLQALFVHVFLIYYMIYIYMFYLFIDLCIYLFVYLFFDMFRFLKPQLLKVMWIETNPIAVEKTWLPGQVIVYVRKREKWHPKVETGA